MTTATRTLTELSVLLQTERDALLALPPEPRRNAELLAGLPFADALEVRPTPAGGAALGEAARVVAWNAERCRDVEAAAAFLAALAPDVVLLSELDCGMARSGNRHTARELAARLGCGYAFGVEFLELGLGGRAERRAHAGQENAVGYHGGAILSRAPLLRPKLVRLETEGAWFGPERDERRIGGRIAIVAEVELGGVPVALASLHLESHGSPEGRAAQLGVALDALGPHVPALLGGDLNTLSLGLGELLDPRRGPAALRDDPLRFGNPVPHEPLFPRAAAAGFAWEDYNVARAPTHRVVRGVSSERGQFKLDWLLGRGLRAERPEVVAALGADGRALSDHEALTVTVRVAD